MQLSLQHDVPQHAVNRLAQALQEVQMKLTCGIALALIA